MVSLIERLLGKGMQLSIYDRDVSSANVIGANRRTWSARSRTSGS